MKKIMEIMKNLSNINKTGLCFLFSSLMTIVVILSTQEMSTWRYQDEELYLFFITIPSILGFITFFVGSLFLFLHKD